MVLGAIDTWDPHSSSLAEGRLRQVARVALLVFMLCPHGLASASPSKAQSAALFSDIPAFADVADEAILCLANTHCDDAVVRSSVLRRERLYIYIYIYGPHLISWADILHFGHFCPVL